MDLGKKLFNEYWHLACHRKELTNDGDFIKFKTPIGDVVIFNDNGEITAFDNKCAHRGTSIYTENIGNQKNFCKYHGWTYSSGVLIIPSVSKYINCNIELANIKKFKVQWCGDFIFLGITPLLSLYDQLGDISNDLENIGFNIDRRFDFNNYDYNCYWPIALENALEPDHIDLVHPNTLSTLKLNNGINYFNDYTSKWCAKIQDSRINSQLSKFEKYYDIDYKYEGYSSIYIFPFGMISSTYGYSYSLQNFFPSSSERNKTNFYSRLLTSNLKNDAAHTLMHSFFESTAKVNRLVFEEDHSICRLMPADSWSSEPLRYPSTDEAKIDHFRMLCRKAS